jgi:hypothetical protein
MKELTDPIGFFHDVLWPNPDEHPGHPMAVRRILILKSIFDIKVCAHLNYQK